MLPTAIEDTEELQTAADWSTGNYKTHHAVRPSPAAVEFLGTEVACYVYTLEVPSGTGEVTVITQPIRWSICEPTVDAGDFEMLRSGVSNVGGYDVPNAISRDATQPFALGEWLPSSGNSHCESSDPYLAYMKQNWNACEAHVANMNGSVTVYPFSIRRPAKYYMCPKYIQWRVNGVAVGAVQDLTDYLASTNPLGLYAGMYYAHGIGGLDVWSIPFPSGHAYWTNHGNGKLDNWNLEFAPGDTIEVDVWYEIGAQKHATDSKKLCVSFGRYATDDNQHYYDKTTPTPTSGYFLSHGGTSPFWASGLGLFGINMSNGFNPSTHTYTFTPADGQFEFGKAEAAGATRFVLTSKRLEWSFSESAGGSCGGTSTWQVQEVEASLQWVLISDDCEGVGTPVAPTSDPSEAGIEETTACDCSTAGSGDTWNISLQLVYEYEIAYIQIDFQQITGGSALARLFYRPESTGDYVENVTDRWEGTMKCGPTGVFDHMGTTTFKLWQGVKQTSGAYPTGLPSAYSALTGILPTEFTVTKVLQ